MFKNPRKTIISDTRITTEALFNKIITRLESPNREEFLLQVMPIVGGEDSIKKEEYFDLFVETVHEWLTEKERHQYRRLKSMGVCRRHLCISCGSYEHTDNACGEIICSQCGVVETYINNTHSGLTFSQQQDVGEQQIYPYRRSNHFSEWCTNFQAKGSTTIPDEVYERIENQMKKQRIYDVDKLNTNVLKSMMKELKLNKYYENIPHILYKLNGQPPPRLTDTQEQQMKIMFNQILNPFDVAVAAVAPMRKNFLSYSYVLRKFSELLELDHITESFTLLKSREKLAIQDLIWKNICGQLGWRFIPSI